jgi:hypothetical protein
MALRPQIGRQKIRLNLLGGVFNCDYGCFRYRSPRCQQLIRHLAHLLTIDTAPEPVKQGIWIFVPVSVFSWDHCQSDLTLIL